MRLSILGYVLATGLVGCATTTGAPAPARVAVFPLDGVGMPKEDVARVRKTIAQRIDKLPNVKVVAADEEQLAACNAAEDAEAVSCAAQVGRQAGADHVVLGALGGLGSTYVLQLKLVAVRRAAVTRSLEETVFGKRETQQAAFSNLAERLIGIRAATPWYRRWWVWGIVTVAAASAAIAVPLAVRDSDPYRDINLP